MSNFTKGPWHGVAENFEIDNIEILSNPNSSRVPICTIKVGFSGQVEDEQQANVNLIAAAPDMYDLLLSVRPEIESSIETPCGDLEPVFSKECRILLSNIDKVLAKARGESSGMPQFKGTREALSKLSIGGDE